jgi:F-type H+-transporting ATPase subunit delta
MKSDYSQAFLKSLEAGMSVDAAILGLKSAMKKKQQTKLFGAVLLEVLRTVETEKGSKQAVVSVSKTTDIKLLKVTIAAALKELGVEKSTTVKEVVDETLVGGFVATYDYKEHDASYKKSLTKLYESIIK